MVALETDEGTGVNPRISFEGTDPEAVARRLNYAAEQSDQPARGLKKRLSDYAGVSEQAVSGWFRTGKVKGEHFPTIARFLGCDLEWLMTGRGSLELQYCVPYGIEMMEVPIVGDLDVPRDSKHRKDSNVTAWLQAPATDPDAYALRVSSSRYSPRYRQGEVVLLYPNAECQPGDEVYVVTKDGDCQLFTLLYHRSEANEYAFEPILPSLGDRKVYRASDIDRMHLLAGAFRAHAVRVVQSA